MVFKALVIVSSLFSFIQTSSAQKSYDSCMHTGIQLMSQNKYNDAIKSFEICLNKNPKDAYAYFQRGTSYLMLKKANIALVDFNQALLLDQNLYEAYYNRGLAHQALSNYTFAEADFLLYKEKVTNDHNVIRNLALLMEEMLDYTSAIKYYTEFLDLHPEDKEIRKARALAYAESNLLQEAVNDLDICLKPDANDTAIWMCKGNIYYDFQEFDKAIDAYNVILLIHPSCINALYNRADAYLAARRYEEAIRDYQFLSLLDIGNPEYYFNLGFCYLQLNKNNEAIIAFGKSLDTNYKNTGLLLTLRGVAYNNMHKLAEACSDWQNAINSGYVEAMNYKKNYCSH